MELHHTGCKNNIGTFALEPLQLCRRSACLGGLRTPRESVHELGEVVV